MISERERVVLLALAGQPQLRSYPYELMKLTGMSNGSVYRALIGLEGDRLIVRRWEADPPSWRLTPPRKYAMITTRGMATVNALRASSESAPPCAP